MKNYIKLLVLSLLTIFLFVNTSSLIASNIKIPGSDKLSKVSIEYKTNQDIEDTINFTGFKILTIAKIILQGVLLIYIVYIGGQMIMAMGDNEEMLSSSKRQLWYSIIAIIFINIPGTIYQSFSKDKYGDIDTNLSSYTNSGLNGNIFLDPFFFGVTFEDKIIGFFKIAIYASAVIMFLIAGYRIMLARGNEESINKSKTYFKYGLISLVFAGVIDVWKYIIFNGSISEGIDFFSKLANIMLFFAGPVAIFFLTFAGYYYITANGDEEKIKKSKNIIINTILGTLIILASYTFLLDLATL